MGSVPRCVGSRTGSGLCWTLPRGGESWRRVRRVVGGGGGARGETMGCMWRGVRRSVVQALLPRKFRGGALAD